MNRQTVSRTVSKSTSPEGRPSASRDLFEYLHSVTQELELS